jgi:hypothetical protein
MFELVTSLLVGWSSVFFFGTLPSTTNYSLQSYGFGSGGTANSSTGSYSLEGITGEISGQTGTTAAYNLKPGYIEAQQANVPNVTLTNPSSYYDKLKFVIDQQNNPTDAKYALQVCIGSDFTPTSSSPTCGGTIRYVKSDDTLGSVLNTTDYQTYTAWGGATGTTIIGLSASTTYYIHAKATQGQFTESGYGPSSNAATVGQSISFCLYTNANCGAGGHSETLSLLAGSVANSATNIGVDFETNADSGGSVYIYSTGALTSSLRPGTPINSSTADLSSATNGYGAQIASVTQSSGGPLAKLSPYNLASNNVGQIATTVATILNSSSPLVGGQAAIQLQAKADTLTKAASDYTDTITIVAAASF